MEFIDKHKNKIQATIVVFFTTIIACIFYSILKTPNIIFIANIFIMICILIKAKFSYFSMKAFIMNYILVAVFFQYVTGKSYGILERTNMNLYYFEMNILIYLYNIISYIWISYTKILDNESELLKENYNLKKFSTYFCCILAIVTTIIAFPGLPFDKAYVTNRFNGLLPGNAWNHIAMVSLLFLLPNLKKNNIVKITYIFVIFWFLSHYERVDIIGLLLTCFIYFLVRKRTIKFKTYIFVGLIAITTIFTMVYLGEARVDESKKISITDMFRKTLVQNTAADIGYVFNSSIEYVKNEELLKGKTYGTYILELLPFVDSNQRCDKILNEKYNAPGGEFILSEPIMNFGLIGGIVFQLVEFGIYTIILSKKSKYRFFVYIFLIMTVFRTSWYGWVYIEKAIVYFIPIIYFITKLLDNYENRKNEESSKKEDDKRVKVLFYSEKWDSGGIEAFIMNIYRNLDKEKIKADILTSQNQTDIYDEEIEKLGGKKFITLDKKYDSPIIRTLKNFSKFKKALQSSNYDVIHLNICHGVAMIYAYIAKKAGIKCVILHSHNADIGNKQKTIKILGHNICKYLFERYADEFLACSDLAAKWLYTKRILNSDKVKIINNAIDSKKFIFNKQERYNFRKELGINDKFVIGHIGRFCEQKNHNYLIDVFKEINNIDKNSVLLLVGDGELKQEIINKVDNLGLSEDVIFYGLTKDIPKLLWTMDVFVLPSLFEGKPIVGIETQAAALKTFMSDTITSTLKISDYVEYLSIQDEPKKWANKIIKIGKDYGRKNMQDVIEKNGYEINCIAKDMEELYIAIVSDKKA